MADYQWQPIPHSTNVRRATVAPDLGGVVVEFSDGAQYLYAGATRADLDGLVMSPSPGSYVQRQFRQFQTTKL